MNAIDHAVASGLSPRFFSVAVSVILSAALAGVARAADAPARKSNDQVLVATSDGRGAPAKWTGEILEYTGHGLQLRLADGHEKLFPATRIVSISTTSSTEQKAGDTAFGQADFRRALGHYRAALEGKHESREWVRRQILAQIVWCYKALGAWESACDYFLILLERDRTTPYFDCVPLTWLPEEPSPSLQKKAKQWLAKTDSPCETLLGANHLLSTADRPAALDALARLSTDGDSRIALLAEAQTWRTQAFQATDKQASAWQQTAAKMPEDLRAGPDFLIGSALVARHPEEAILWLLRSAILDPRQRQIATAGLSAAAKALDKLDRHVEALALWTEIVTSYPDQPLPAKAAGEHLAGGKSRSLHGGLEISREPADQRFVAGLRRRGLFVLAESFCRGRLGNSQLDEVLRAELVIDLVRTLAEHALASPPDEREPIWQEISKTTTEFQRAHPHNPRVLLVRMQAALAVLARAELARQEAETGTSAAISLDSVRTAIRTAIVGLKQLDDDLVAEIRRRSRPVEAGAGMLSDAELASLEANVRYQLARGFRNQALSYPPESNDRLNALTQAIELLAPLAKAADDDPLAWPSRVEEIVCLRQVGKLAEATHRLADLESGTPPTAQMRRLRAEGVRLLMAKGRLAEALTAAGPPIDDDEPGAAELDFARLEVLVALWQRAGGPGADLDPQPEAAGAEAGGDRPATDWQRQATAQVGHIEKVHGPYWMRRAETLLAESLAAGGMHQPAGTPGNLDSLVRAAASFWRAGQAEEALTTYDQAAKAAIEAGNAEKAFELAMTAASIQNQRKQFPDAERRFHELAASMPNHPRAAEADLAAIYNEAAAAAAEGKSRDPKVLAEYQHNLENHLAAWPQSSTSGQAGWWLGRLYQHEGQWSAAIAALRRVPAEHAQYAAAVEATAAAYSRLLDQARTAGKPDPELARQAVDWLRQVIVESSGKSDEGLVLARQAVLSAARISMSDLPDGAADAEDMLRQALAEGAQAPNDWQVAARLLLVSALAQRQRFDEAAEVLRQGAGGSAGDLLALLERLNQATERAKPAERPTLIRLEQQTLAELDAKKPRFDEAGQRRFQTARLRTLIDTGQGQTALTLAESLAKKYPDDGSLQEDYARLLARSTDPAQLRLAFARWREVVERSRAGTPRWFRGQLGLAQTQLALNNRAQARTIVKIVEAGYPDFSPAGGEKDPQQRAAFLDVLARSEKPN